MATLLVAGCATDPIPAPEPVRSDTATIQVGGTPRTYHVYRPARLPTAAPLVVMLHGSGGSGQDSERGYGWDRVADRAGFVVAYPDGLGLSWNAGSCCGSPVRNQVDDAGFIMAMVDRIDEQIPLDPARIYVAGMSNGGMLAYTLACRTDRFAAIGAVSATLVTDCPAPRPVSVIHVHGTLDRTVRYNGGDRGWIRGPGVVELNARWREIDGCAPPVDDAGGPASRLTATCRDGRAVELVTVAGGPHGWPATDPDTTATLWDFFAAHPKPG